MAEPCSFQHAVLCSALQCRVAAWCQPEAFSTVGRGCSSEWVVVTTDQSSISAKLSPKNKVTLMVGFVKWAQGSVIKGGLVQIVRWDPLLATVGLRGCPDHPLQSWLVALQGGTRVWFQCFLFKPRGPSWRRTNEGEKRAASTVFGSKTALYVLRTILRTAMCIGCSFSRSHGTWEYVSHHVGRLASHHLVGDHKSAWNETH